MIGYLNLSNSISEFNMIIICMLFKKSVSVTNCMHLFSKVKRKLQGFPGGAVVGSPPANAGDMGSGSGLGGSHMPRSN